MVSWRPAFIPARQVDRQKHTLEDYFYGGDDIDWADGRDMSEALGSTGVPINFQADAQSSGLDPCQNATHPDCQRLQLSFGSAHSGGMQGLRCDGSATFYQEDIDPIVYRDLGTRASQEPVSSGGLGGLGGNRSARHSPVFPHLAQQGLQHVIKSSKTVAMDCAPKYGRLIAAINAGVMCVAILGCDGGNAATQEPAINHFITAREAILDGDNEKAMQALTASIEAKPMGWAYLERAKLHLEMGNDEAAIADCFEGLEAEPQGKDLKWLLSEAKKPKQDRFKGKNANPPSASK